MMVVGGMNSLACEGVMSFGDARMDSRSEMFGM